MNGILNRKSFYISVVILLLITALAKLVSGFGSAGILNTNDSLWPIKMRYLLLLTAAIELLVILCVLFSKQALVKSCAVVCIGCQFLLYRGALFLLGDSHPCPCLGTITGWLKVSPQAASQITLYIALYIAIGGAIIFIKDIPQERASDGL